MNLNFGTTDSVDFALNMFTTESSNIAETTENPPIATTLPVLADSLFTTESIINLTTPLPPLNPQTTPDTLILETTDSILDDFDFTTEGAGIATTEQQQLLQTTDDYILFNIAKVVKMEKIKILCVYRCNNFRKFGNFGYNLW